YLQRAGVFSLQQPMPPGIKPPQHCASPEPFRLDADSTTVFLFRNPSHLHSVLRIPQNIIRLQPLHFSYEKGRRVSLLRPGPGANCHYGSLTPT
ncbi:integrase, partial [Escherichia coli]